MTAAAGAAAGASAGAAASLAAVGPAQEFGEATDVQLEELEALESIFASEYSLVSSSPPHFVIKLREPGSEDVDDGPQLPASALFSLRFKLPKVSCRMHMSRSALGCWCLVFATAKLRCTLWVRMCSLQQTLACHVHLSQDTRVHKLRR